MIFQLTIDDIQAMLIIFIIVASILIANRLISFILKRLKYISRKIKIYIGFFLQLITFGIVIFLILDGIPFINDFLNAHPAEVAVFTSSISIAIAFASSGIFSNLISGFMLFSLKPFEVGDLIKLDGETGVVRTISLITTIIETFDNILVEKANNDVINAELINYSINIDNLKTFVDFKKEIHYSEDLISPKKIQNSQKAYDLKLKKLFKTVIKKRKRSKLFNFLFSMEFPYDGFHKLINEVEEICAKYEEIFEFKPLYHIFSFDNFIKVNFRILTFNSSKIFNHQPAFAKEIYSAIFKHHINLRER